MVKKEWIEKGFVDEPVDATLDLKQEIRRLCKEKDAIILAHGDVRCALYGRNLQTAES